MSLDTSVINNSVLPIANEGANVDDKPKKRPRAELLSEGKLVLTEKIDIVTRSRLKIEALLGKFQEIKHPHMAEHLMDQEKPYFKEKVDILSLPIGGIIELWEKIPGSEEFQVTEYKKLK